MGTVIGTERSETGRGARRGLAALAAALLVGTAVACAGPVDPDTLAPCADASRRLPTVEVAAPPTLPAGDANAGEAVFAEHCARCHTPRVAERDSRLFRDYPRLDCDSYLEAAGPGRMLAVILDGGEVYGLNKLMKPFRGVLSAEELADLLAYLRAAGPRT